MDVFFQLEQLNHWLRSKFIANITRDLLCGAACDMFNLGVLHLNLYMLSAAPINMSHHNKYLR